MRPIAKVERSGDKNERNPVDTRKILKSLIFRGFDANTLDGIHLDARETAVFVAELMRQLRLCAISAKMHHLELLIEATYYEASRAATPLKIGDCAKHLNQFNVT